MQQHRLYWHMEVPRYSFSGSVPAKFEHKLSRHKQTLGSLRYGNYGPRTTAGRALSFVCSTGLSRANIER